MKKNTINEINSELELSSLLEEVSLKEEANISKKSLAESSKHFFSKLNSNRVEFLQRNPLLSYSIKRIIYAFITLYITIIIAFALLRVVTPDTAYLAGVSDKHPALQAGPGTVEYEKFLEERMKMFGAYGSLIEQILIYLKNITFFIPKTVLVDTYFDAELGEQINIYETKLIYLGVFMNTATGGTAGTPVQDAFKQAIPVSFKIGGISVLLSYVIGIPLGILSAKNKDKTADSAINGTSLVISAIPALVIISIFYTISIQWLGAGGIYVGANFYTKIFPVIGIMLMTMPLIIISTRRFVVDEMTSDYVKFAMSKGLSKQYVFYVHIFRNAGIRLVKTMPEVLVMTLFGSSILVEKHWSIPGMSGFILSGVTNKDTFVVLGYIFVSASAGVFSSLIGDLLLATLDPRIKLTK